MRDVCDDVSTIPVRDDVSTILNTLRLFVTRRNNPSPPSSNGLGFCSLFTGKKPKPLDEDGDALFGRKPVEEPWVGQTI